MDQHIAALAARDRALDQQQIAININLNHTQIARSRSHITHVTGHLLTWEHTARRLALTNGTWRPVGARVAVGRILHGKVIALDGALKPFSDAGSRDIDHLPDRKLIDLDLTAHREARALLVRPIARAPV